MEFTIRGGRLGKKLDISIIFFIADGIKMLIRNPMENSIFKTFPYKQWMLWCYIVMFLDIPYLRELALNNNPLQKIEGLAFEMVPQLVALDVSGDLHKPFSGWI